MPARRSITWPISTSRRSSRYSTPSPAPAPRDRNRAPRWRSCGQGTRLELRDLRELAVAEHEDRAAAPSCAAVSISRPVMRNAPSPARPRTALRGTRVWRRSRRARVPHARVVHGREEPSGAFEPEALHGEEGRRSRCRRVRSVRAPNRRLQCRSRRRARRRPCRSPPRHARSTAACPSAMAARMARRRVDARAREQRRHERRGVPIDGDVRCVVAPGPSGHVDVDERASRCGRSCRSPPRRTGTRWPGSHCSRARWSARTAARRRRIRATGRAGATRERRPCRGRGRDRRLERLGEGDDVRRAAAPKPR